MKSVATFLHRTPWWALILGGFAILVTLAIFVTPFYLIRLDQLGSTPAEAEAIKREVTFAFSESAIDVARTVLREMRERARDPSKRDELDRALEELDEARQELRQAGREAQRAKKEAVEEIGKAVTEASRAIAEAKRQAARALESSGADSEKVTRSLEESLEAARQAEAEAKRAIEEAAAKSGTGTSDAKSEGPAPDAKPDTAAPDAKPDTAAPDAKPDAAAPATKPREKRRIVIGTGDKPMVDIQLDDKSPPLPEELRTEIRRKVQKDLYRIGIGSGLFLIFIPLFALTIIAKFFIDRSRAAQRVAEEKTREADYRRMSQQVTEAKLQALQAQVEPHFLYNTLASVQALTEVDPARANAMTGHLIQYLRNALPKMRESQSTIGQEIELVRAYLNILQMRMGKRLSFDIVVPPELVDAPFPPLMLPSLVENAIKHGLEPQREGGNITVIAEERDGKLRLSVKDTGRGFAESLGSGVGLSNIRERLAAIHGEAGKLTLEANEPHGVVATIEVPKVPPKPASAGAQSAAAPAPEPSPTATRRTLAAMGTAERVWRKGLSFVFIALVVVAAIVCGLAIFAMTGVIPIDIQHELPVGPTGALIGTAGILFAFVVIVLAIALVIAIVYGLGFVLVGLAIFIPIVVLVGLMPALAPFILVGLAVWWFVRRSERKEALERMKADERR